MLCRFRQEPIAFMCDIEAMFHQVKVSEEHRDLLRFLWWEDDDLTKELKEYRMTVHLFGASLCSTVKKSSEESQSKKGRRWCEGVRLRP